MIESVFKNNLLANKGYLFKFDLKNGYHIYIVDYHQNISQFFWNINGLQSVSYSLSYLLAYRLHYLFLGK